jgi:hypothetical protein
LQNWPLARVDLPPVPVRVDNVIYLSYISRKGLPLSLVVWCCLVVISERKGSIDFSLLSSIEYRDTAYSIQRYSVLYGETGA